MLGMEKAVACILRCLRYFSTNTSHYLILCAVASFVFSVSATPVPSPHVPYHKAIDTSIQYGEKATFNVRVGAATCAAASMTASFVAFYWFCRMEKRFRHRLVIGMLTGSI
jgi:hypothetical protein